MGSVPVGAATMVPLGNRITVLGTPEELEKARSRSGASRRESGLDLDRKYLDYRRIFVSSKEVAGRKIRDLKLPQRFRGRHLPGPPGGCGAEARSGHGPGVGRPGRGSFLPPSHMTEVSHFFGDSYKALTEVNILTFGLGMFGGMLLGMVPIPVAPGVTLHLGLAGGPLVVGLILGAKAVTGPLGGPRPFYWTVTAARARREAEVEDTPSKNPMNWADSAVSYPPRFWAHRYPMGWYQSSTSTSRGPEALPTLTTYRVVSPPPTKSPSPEPLPLLPPHRPRRWPCRSPVAGGGCP